jgi:hypothetical protein
MSRLREENILLPSNLAPIDSTREGVCFNDHVHIVPVTNPPQIQQEHDDDICSNAIEITKNSAKINLQMLEIEAPTDSSPGTNTEDFGRTCLGSVTGIYFKRLTGVSG